MPNLALANFRDLEEWSRKTEAQNLLPLLVRRLILATYGPPGRLVNLHFPVSDGTQRRGWDGIVEFDGNHPYIPSGCSGWEVGTGNDVGGKANSDYASRRKNQWGLEPAATEFIFVSSRPWPDNGISKEEWAKKKRETGFWRNVRAYDAIDLETWLSLAPAVHAWISAVLGKDPERFEALFTCWQRWARATHPAMTSELVVAGRAAQAEEVQQWCKARPGVHGVAAESREEALGFVMAALNQLDAEERETIEARGLVVHDVGAWQQALRSGTGLFLIPLFENPDLTKALDGGHCVIIPYGMEACDLDGVLTLPRPRRQAVRVALQAMKLSTAKAQRLAYGTRRSFLSLRRALAIEGGLQQPLWAKSGKAQGLLPILLAGMWEADSAVDRAVLAALAGKSYSFVERVLTRWVSESDPPVRRVAGRWMIAAPEDTWGLLERYLTPDDLRRLEDVVLRVFAERTPSGEPLAFASRTVQSGLADTLAIMGGRHEAGRLLDGKSLQMYTVGIVYRLLAAANDDKTGERWQALHSVLPLLAEAAPDSLLEAFRLGIAQEQPPLFSHGRLPPVQVRWALENLAWHRDYVGEATHLLAWLARPQARLQMDSSSWGRLVNGPLASLWHIYFLEWPQTTATWVERRAILAKLATSEPEVAWSLLLSLLPRLKEQVRSIHTPRWRDWSPEEELPLTPDAELWQGIEEVARQLLNHVGNDLPRWKSLIQKLEVLPLTFWEPVIEALLKVTALLGELERSLLCGSLRKVLARHHGQAERDWAIPAEPLERLLSCYREIEPVAPTLKHRWLFDNRPDYWGYKRGDFDSYRAQLAQSRADALTQVYSLGGLPLIMEWGSQVENPYELGVCLGLQGLAVEEESAFLEAQLGSLDEAHAWVVRGYVRARLHVQGVEWGEGMLEEAGPGWSPVQRAEFLMMMPASSRTWDWAARFGAVTEHEAWLRFFAFELPGPEECVNAAQRLLDHGRSHMAMVVLAPYVGKVHVRPPAELVTGLLEQVAALPFPLGIERSVFIGYVTILLDYLDASQGVDDIRRAGLDWVYLPLLQFGEGPARRLHRELALSPSFFAGVVEQSEENQTASELLETWRDVPGVQDDGLLNSDALLEWVVQADMLLAEKGLQASGRYYIGRLLRYAPSEVDGRWPHEAVCRVLEEVASRELADGFIAEVRLSRGGPIRGTVQRGTLEEGSRERALATQYRAYAEAIKTEWPRAAQVIRSIATLYEEQAGSYDQRAILQEDL